MTSNEARSKSPSPWKKFAYLGEVALWEGGIGVRGSGKLFRSGIGEGIEGRYLPHGRESGAGGGAEVPKEVAAFAQRQSKLVRQNEVGPDFWLPQWVREHINRGGSPDDLIKSVLERVRQNTSEATLQEAQAILNELNRGSEGTALVSKTVTCDLAEEMDKLRCEGRK